MGKAGTLPPDCANCSAGRFTNIDGLTRCLLCPEGYAARESGAKDCARCPKHETTPSEGGDTCSCEAQFYRVNGTCSPCPEAIQCDAIGSDLQNISLKRGMWRAGPDDNTFLACPVSETCVGGNDTHALCLAGHRGPLCAICDAGYSRWRNTVPCAKCPEDMAPSIIVAIVATLGGLFLLVVCLIFNRRTPNGVLRPLINAAQNMAVVMMFPIKWPDSVSV